MGKVKALVDLFLIHPPSTLLVISLVSFFPFLDFVSQKVAVGSGEQDNERREHLSTLLRVEGVVSRLLSMGKTIVCAD